MARGFDRFGNEFQLSGVTVAWHAVPAEIGEMNARTGVFQAGSGSGSGYVIAVVSGSMRFGSAGLSQGAAKLSVLDALPRTFSVEANYPNPFNSSTTIGFALPDESPVSVRVFSPSGQMLSTVVDEIYPRGRHTVDLNMGSRPSGVYFYEVLTDFGATTRKMMLVR